MAFRYTRREASTPEQQRADALRALLAPKRISRTPYEIVCDASLRTGCMYPSPDRSERWRMRFYRVDDMMRAQLYARGCDAPLIALDHHRGRAEDMFGDVLPPGYHWDVFWPFKADGVVKARIRIDNRFTYSEETVLFVARMWNLELQIDPQGELWRTT